MGESFRSLRLLFPRITFPATLHACRAYCSINYADVTRDFTPLWSPHIARDPLARAAAKLRSEKRDSARPSREKQPSINDLFLSPSLSFFSRQLTSRDNLACDNISIDIAARNFIKTDHTCGKGRSIKKKRKREKERERETTEIAASRFMPRAARRRRIVRDVSIISTIFRGGDRAGRLIDAPSARIRSRRSACGFIGDRGSPAPYSSWRKSRASIVSRAPSLRESHYLNASCQWRRRARVI